MLESYQMNAKLRRFMVYECPKNMSWLTYALSYGGSNLEIIVVDEDVN